MHARIYGVGALLYSPYIALLTLEKSLLTIKNTVIDHESPLQHLTLRSSTPGKFWIRA